MITYSQTTTTTWWNEHMLDVASSDEACSDEFKVSKGSNKKWNEKHTTTFIDLLEERICLHMGYI